MFPKSVTQAYTSFSDIDLETCVAFDSINHILAGTGASRCKSDMSTWGIDKCGGVGVEAGVAARPAKGERTAVLTSSSRVSEGTSDYIITQVLITWISIQDAQWLKNSCSVGILIFTDDHSMSTGRPLWPFQTPTTER